MKHIHKHFSEELLKVRETEPSLESRNKSMQWKTSCFSSPLPNSEHGVFCKDHAHGVLGFGGNSALVLHATHSNGHRRCLCCCASEFKGSHH
jgi:hypothetical protein